MSRILSAIFDNRRDADAAISELLLSGFPRSAIHLGAGDPDALRRAQSEPGRPGARHDDGGGNFFHTLFGTDDSPWVRAIDGAVTHSHQVLTVVAPDLPEVERAAAIVERYGPLDIDATSGEGQAPGPASAAAWQAWARAHPGGAGRSSADPGLRLERGTSQQAGPLSQQQAEPPGQPHPAALRREAGGGSSSDANSSGSAGNGASSGNSGMGGFSNPDGSSSFGSSGNVSNSSNSSNSTSSTISSGNLQRADSSGPVDLHAMHLEAMRRHFETHYSKEGSTEEKGAAAFEDANRAARQVQLAAGRFPGDEHYDEYAPAYLYGLDMATHEQHGGKEWEEAEPALRGEWEQRHPQSAWAKFKDAVRHGWERLRQERPGH